jgi:hypothetical protein
MKQQHYVPRDHSRNVPVKSSALTNGIFFQYHNHGVASSLVAASNARKGSFRSTFGETGLSRPSVTPIW